MHVLLPPSETKRSGGTAPFAVDRLAFPELTERRVVLRDALIDLSRDRDAAARALKLGPRQLDEIDRNAALASPRAMPAVDRFDGVLFDALDAGSLGADARERLGRTVVIQSALWGPVGALDGIPAYRLSHDSRVPGFPLKRWWSQQATAAIAGLSGLVLDLRSEAYAALGPLTRAEDRRFVRVRSRDASGALRNLNHFNKQGKGRFVRALMEDGVESDSLGELADWAAGRGFELTPNAETGEVDLVVREA